MNLPLLQEQVHSCTMCSISATKDKYVFARGNPEAKLMILGEAPGSDEDKSGFPFVGKAGQCLDRAIKSLGFDPDQDIYVANILKCRPEDNRRPTTEEIENCFPYLKKQIRLVDPKALLALGNTAVQTLLNTQDGITKLRGTSHEYMERPLIPTYHPSFIIRNGGVNASQFPDFINDIRLAFKIAQGE